MLKLLLLLFVSVVSQYISKEGVKDALAEQKMLERIRPLLDRYLSDSLERNKNSLLGLCEEKISDSQKQTENSMRDGQGTVFTRWGRKRCPENQTTMVYTGFAGGSYYEHTGAAADYVCMPQEPIWGSYKNVHYSGNDVGYVYGAEYQSPGALFSMSTWSDDVPCAVCLGAHYSVTLMIPGRIECYPGWTKAYHGSLASGAHNHKAASQYVCVDQEPEITIRGANENGKLFYGVKAKCGSLPCPPYEEGKFLPCVVCMK